jgi:hypothetical protein
MRAFVVLLLLSVYCAICGATETPSSSKVSVILLSQSRLPDMKAFRENLAKRVSSKFAEATVDIDQSDGFALRSGEVRVVVRLINNPLPTGQIDDLCAAAWYWKQACELTSKHTAQAVVGVFGGSLDALDRSLLLTNAVAAAMNENAIASYWRASLQSRDAFLRQAQSISRQTPPIWLWVNFRVSSDPEKGFSLSTDGMDQFALNEIEAKDVNRPGREVFTLLAGLAEYLVSKGPVVKDGETIGDSPSLNIRVRKGPSYWREGLVVYRVTWPR